MDNKNGFILYKTQYDPVKMLSINQKGMLFDRIFMFQIGNDVESNDAVVEMAFNFFKSQFDIDKKRYEDTIVKRNRNNGKLGGRPVSTYDNPKNPVGLKKPKKAVNDNVNDNDNVNVNDNDNTTREEKVVVVASSEKKEKPPKEKKDQLQFKTDFYQNKELNESFLEFLKYRKRKKLENSDKTINTLLNKLEPYRDSIKIAMIDNAMMCGRKSVFPLKDVDEKKANKVQPGVEEARQYKNKVNSGLLELKDLM